MPEKNKEGKAPSRKTPAKPTTQKPVKAPLGAIDPYIHFQPAPPQPKKT